MLAVLSDLSCGVGSRGRSKRERDETVAGVLFPRAGKPLLIDPFNPYSTLRGRVESETIPGDNTFSDTRRRNVGLLRSIDSRYKRLSRDGFFLTFGSIFVFFSGLPSSSTFLYFSFQTEFWSCVNSTLNGESLNLILSTPFKATQNC